MKKDDRPLKQFPVFKTDEDAERFVETADLSEYDFSQFKPMRFEALEKTARVNMRLPESLLAVVKSTAAQRGMPYQRFIREAIETALFEAAPRKTSTGKRASARPRRQPGSRKRLVIG
jgi:predicted DNA binding CopG/RHH family protein